MTKHFIITLFNLKIWNEDKANMPTQTFEWLEQRFHLFETYCLPSVKAQTCQDFQWLCLFDEGTSEVFRQRIAEWRKSVPQLQPCFFSAEDASHFRDDDPQLRCRFIRQTVASMLDGADYVITTNLDNDDALHRDFVKRVHQAFEETGGEALVTFKTGMQYFVSLDAVARMYYPHNHFLNLIERTDQDFRTIEYFRHAKARKLLHCVDINEHPYWMEVVHACNVSNELRITSRVKYLPQLLTFHFADYGNAKVLPWTKNVLNFLFTLPAYFCRIAVWRLRKKLWQR